MIVSLVLASRPTAAQRWQVDAGGARVRLDTVATLNAASLAPFIEWDKRRLYAALSGAVTRFEGSAVAAQARGDISLMFEPFGRFRPVRLETAAVAAGTYHTSDFRTMMARAEARMHYGTRHAGGWLGGVIASGWTSADRSFVNAVGPALGSWARYGTARGALGFTPLRLGGRWFPELEARTSLAAGPLDLVGYVGWRDAPAGSGLATATWAGVTGAAWFAERAALVITGGSYGPDLLQGLPGGRFISAGLRIASRRATVVSIKPIGRPAYDRTNGTGLLRFSVPEATHVEVAGDWNGWRPVAMQRVADGAWAVQLDLPPGVYRFNLIVDGERWIVPDGVSSLDDGFGGQVGVLVVP